jgi:hypothetical protein
VDFHQSRHVHISRYAGRGAAIKILFPPKIAALPSLPSSPSTNKHNKQINKDGQEIKEEYKDQDVI